MSWQSVGIFERLGEIYGSEHWGNVIKWESYIRGGRKG